MSYLEPLLRADEALHVANIEAAIERGDADEAARLQRVHDAPWGMPPAPPIYDPQLSREAA